jgi:hypothetical protein
VSAPDLSTPKDYAYWERNQLVSALSKLYPAWLERHPADDEEWEDDWRWIVFVTVPGKDKVWESLVPSSNIGYYKKQKRQLSWHIHDTELKNFNHLKFKHGNSWDGHDNDEKYRRLATLKAR